MYTWHTCFHSNKQARLVNRQEEFSLGTGFLLYTIIPKNLRSNPKIRYIPVFYCSLYLKSSKQPLKLGTLLFLSLAMPKIPKITSKIRHNSPFYRSPYLKSPKQAKKLGIACFLSLAIPNTPKLFMNLMMEKSNSCKCHYHSIFVAGFNHRIISHRAAWFCNICYAALFRAFNIVTEWEKCI